MGTCKGVSIQEFLLGFPVNINKIRLSTSSSLSIPNCFLHVRMACRSMQKCTIDRLIEDRNDRCAVCKYRLLRMDSAVKLDRAMYRSSDPAYTVMRFLTIYGDRSCSIDLIGLINIITLLGRKAKTSRLYYNRLSSSSRFRHQN